jgi:hypothetical protein
VHCPAVDDPSRISKRSCIRNSIIIYLNYYAAVPNGNADHEDFMMPEANKMQENLSQRFILRMGSLCSLAQQQASSFFTISQPQQKKDIKQQCNEEKDLLSTNKNSSINAQRALEQQTGERMMVSEKLWRLTINLVRGWRT